MLFYCTKLPHKWCSNVRCQVLGEAAASRVTLSSTSSAASRTCTSGERDFYFTQLLHKYVFTTQNYYKNVFLLHKLLNIFFTTQNYYTNVVATFAARF